MTTMTQGMNQTELKKSISNFIKGRDTGYLGTSGDDVRVSPVKYFIDDDLNVYVHSKGGSKFENLQQNEDVCLLVCTPFEDDLERIKGVQVFGTAQVGGEGSPLYEQAEELCPWSHPADMKVIKINTREITYVDRLSSVETKQTWRH